MPREDTQFKKGNSGGPGRKPHRSIAETLNKIGEMPVPPALKEKLDKALAGCATPKNIHEAVMWRVFVAALGGKDWAIRFIADRTEGKALERVLQDTELSIIWKSLSDTNRTPSSSDSTEAKPDSE